jgi:hypothetical protein
VFENRVLRILGPKKHDVKGEWRKINNQELHGLYYSPNVLRMIKSRRMRLAGHVVRMGREEAHTGFRWENLTERGHWKDPGLDGRIILRWIFRKWAVGYGLY